MKLATNRLTLAGLTVLVLVLGVQLFRKTTESRQQTHQAETHYLQAKTWEANAARSRLQVDSLQLRLGSLMRSPIHPVDVEPLRKRGLSDPVANLIADLQKHPELIPFKGWGGLQMGFYDVDRIRVLSNSWVYAPFDDGHIVGEGIFEYDVAPSGSITWRLVTAHMNS